MSLNTVVLSVTILSTESKSVGENGTLKAEGRLAFHYYNKNGELGEMPFMAWGKVAERITEGEHIVVGELEEVPKYNDTPSFVRLVVRLVDGPINVACIGGNVGQKDPETQWFESGNCKTSHSVGISGKATTWMDVTYWNDAKRKLAEIAGQYLRKGSRVVIAGELRQETWTDKTTGQPRSKLLVNATSLQLPPRKDKDLDEAVIQTHKAMEQVAPWLSEDAPF